MFPSSQKSRESLLDRTVTGTLHIVYLWGKVGERLKYFRSIQRITASETDKLQPL